MKQLFSLKFLWKVYAVLITISIILMLINPDLPMKEVILCLTILIVFRQDYTQLVSDQSKEQPSRTPHVTLSWAAGSAGFLGFSGIPVICFPDRLFPSFSSVSSDFSDSFSRENFPISCATNAFVKMNCVPPQMPPVFASR